MSSTLSRDLRIIAKVACPKCYAPVGDPCRNPHPHQPWRGPEDHRPQPIRPHTERKQAWLEWKQQNGII